MEYLECIKALCEAPIEKRNETILSLLPERCQYEITPLNTLLVTISGQSEEVVVIDAHKDTIGFVVTGITPEGFLKVASRGGVDSRVISGAEVTIWGKTPVYGIFTIMPPHLKKEVSKGVSVEEQLIDVGCSYQEVKEKISLGDFVSYRSVPMALQKDCITAPGLDNLAGVAILIALAKGLQPGSLKKTVILQFSDFEETGHRYAGAITGAFYANPSSAIVVDASFARTPGLQYATPGTFGGGAMIGFSPMLSQAMSMALRDVAKKHQIPYVEEVMGSGSGTNADGILTSRQGIPTALLSYPLKNMHTPVEMVSQGDLDCCVQLLKRYLQEGE